MITKATEIVHWPGKDTPACPDHAAKLRTLARVLGFDLSSTLIIEDIECTNCVNEETKKNKIA